MLLVYSFKSAMLKIITAENTVKVVLVYRSKCLLNMDKYRNSVSFEGYCNTYALFFFFFPPFFWLSLDLILSIEIFSFLCYPILPNSSLALWEEQCMWKSRKIENSLNHLNW